MCCWENKDRSHGDIPEKVSIHWICKSKKQNLLLSFLSRQHPLTDELIPIFSKPLMFDFIYFIFKSVCGFHMNRLPRSGKIIDDVVVLWLSRNYTSRKDGCSSLQQVHFLLFSSLSWSCAISLFVPSFYKLESPCLAQVERIVQIVSGFFLLFYAPVEVKSQDRSLLLTPTPVTTDGGAHIWNIF